MKRLAPAALAALALAACSAPPAPKQEPAAEEGAPGVLRLDADAARRLGLRAEAVGELDAPVEVLGYARALDPAPLAQLVLDLGAARAALDASQRERDRQQRLYRADRTSPARDLELAEAAQARDLAALSGLEARLVLEWGPGVAREPQLAELAGRLVGRHTTLVRVDLPLGAGPPAEPEAIALAGLDGTPLGPVSILGPAPTADPLLPARSWLAALGGDAPPPLGAALAARVRFPGPGPRVLVPAAALLREGGEAVVFVERPDAGYERRAVTLERLAGGDWLVGAGLHAGERVVVAGAGRLLSMQVGPEEE